MNAAQHSTAQHSREGGVRISVEGPRIYTSSDMGRCRGEDEATHHKGRVRVATTYEEASSSSAAGSWTSSDIGRCMGKLKF
jgi:hypothetical protein